MPVHGLAPQNLSPDKHVDVCADSDEDRGSTPLASTFAPGAKVSAITLAEPDEITMCQILAIRSRAVVGRLDSRGRFLLI